MHKKDCVAPIKRPKEDIGEDLSIIIPCARTGKNIKKYGLKSLLNVGGITLLEYQINTIKLVYPRAEIILVVGEDAYKIKKSLKNNYPEIRYVYNPVFDQSNVLYGIGLGVYNRLSTRILIIYGDLLFNKYTIQNITADNSSILVDVDNYLCDRKPGILFIDNNIERFTYDIRPKWGQICYLKEQELKLFEKCMLNNNWCGHEALNYIIENGGKLKPFANSPYFLMEIDSLTDIDKLSKFKG